MSTVASPVGPAVADVLPPSVPHFSVPKQVTLSTLLHFTLDHDASDLHLTSGERPWVRIHGKMHILGGIPPIADDQMKAMVAGCLSPDQWHRLETERSVDAATGVGHGGREVRFRLNAYHHRGALALAVRALPSLSLSFPDLRLHPGVADLVEQRDGLIVVSGPTGSGKTTTLAAMLHAINSKREGHIITIEDPVEYHHPCLKSLVHQREVGSDVPSFSAGVRDALREDPNVMLIGEMRDYETMRQAITAAETGHLVFSTLHTGSAAETISRILGIVSGADGAAVRAQLAVSLRAVVAQKLLPRADGRGRVPVVEILRVTRGVANILRTGRDEQIISAIEAGGRHGMVSFEESAGRLVAQGLLKFEDALGVSADEGGLNHWIKTWKETVSSS